MANNCFAYKKHWTPIGGFSDDKRILCCALSSIEAHKYEKVGICGTMGCPFYKPYNQTDMIRTKDELIEPIRYRE